MDAFGADLRQAARRLLASPAFTGVAVLTLALGIGANTAIFSVVNGVLLRPLPFHDPAGLVLLSETVRREGVERRPFSYPDFVDWRARSTAFFGMAAFSQESFTLAGDEPERITGEVVSAEYLPLLGVRPKSGRAFAAEEDADPGAHAVALVSEALWKRRFGSDPALVGRSLELNGRAFEVVGILPEGFRGVTDLAEMWIPMAMAEVVGRGDDMTDRGDRWHGAIARLRSGVTRERAQAELDGIARALAESHPETNADRGALVLDLQRETFGLLRPALLVLTGAVGFVLLLGCANLANLTLVRAAGRRREIALRAALGAGRRHLVKQLLAESLLLATAGGLVGLGLAYWGVDLLVALSPVQLPSFVQIGLDARVLAFTALLAVGTGLAFGVGPALSTARTDLRFAMEESGRGGGESRAGKRVSAVLVVAQVALALVLLVGAGLMLRSFAKLQGREPGFDPQGVLTFRLDLPAGDLPDEELAAFAERVHQRLRALPGVSAATLASDTPLERVISARTGVPEGGEVEREFRFYEHTVTPGFFTTLRIPLRSGRDFTPDDGLGGPDVAIVGRAMVRRLWPDGEAIGKRFRVGGAEGPWVTVVGVAEEVRHRTLVDDATVFPADPDVYRPLAQEPPTSFSVALRTEAEPAALVAAARAAVREIAPAATVSQVETMTERIGRETALSRFSATLLGGFAGIAVILAAIGVYGVLAQSVSRRAREFGVRMALGAERPQVLRAVLRRGAALGLAGVVVGLPVALALTRLLRGLLVEVPTTDAVTYATVSLLLLSVALFASFVPARRATRVDPVAALRSA